VLAFAGAVYLDLDPLDVCSPDSIGLSIRMADIVPEMGALAADITLSHFTPPS
jgi:hypothetical protein